MSVISIEAAARSWAEPRFQIRDQFDLLRRCGAKLGPYVLLELLLPGGTLFALLLFLYQRRKINAGSRATLIGLASPPALVSTLGRGILAMQSEVKGKERSWKAPLSIVRSARARAQPDFRRARAEVSIK